MKVTFSHPRVGGGARDAVVGGGHWNTMLPF